MLETQRFAAFRGKIRRKPNDAPSCPCRCRIWLVGNRRRYAAAVLRTENGEEWALSAYYGLNFSDLSFNLFVDIVKVPPA